MANEYQPLDINQHPMGCLCPGELYALDDVSSVTLPNAGVYRVYFQNNTRMGVSLPDGTSSTIYAMQGTIEYFYLPAGTEVSNETDSTSIYLIKMN